MYYLDSDGNRYPVPDPNLAEKKRNYHANMRRDTIIMKLMKPHYITFNISKIDRHLITPYSVRMFFKVFLWPDFKKKIWR